MYQEKMNELLDDGTVMIATDGFCVGKINGLAVLDMGEMCIRDRARKTI